jgi:hypothetical protein
MLQVESVIQHGYTTLINANGGEEQIVIVSTGGQSGHVAFTILHTAVDGGHVGWEGAGVKQLCHVKYGTHTEAQARREMARVLRSIPLPERDVTRALRAALGEE